jgi:hypothetical protein
MGKFILGTVIIIVGLVAIGFRDKLVRNSIEYQNRAFGFHFGEEEIKAGKRTAPIIGVACIIMGLWVFWS